MIMTHGNNAKVGDADEIKKTTKTKKYKIKDPDLKKRMLIFWYATHSELYGTKKTRTKSTTKTKTNKKNHSILGDFSEIKEAREYLWDSLDWFTDDEVADLVSQCKRFASNIVDFSIKWIKNWI